MNLEQFLRRLIRLSRYKQVTSVPTPVFQGDLLEGRLALITGGSSGIGLAIAQRFVAHGCDVILASRNVDKLQNAAQTIGHSKCAWIKLDLRDVSTFDKIVKEASDLISGHQGIDILVNSAGVHGEENFPFTDENTWDSVLHTNLKGPYFLSQSVAIHMRDRGIRGNILNIGSASALKPGWSPYEISKRSLESMTQGLADCLINQGIIVSCLAPGPVLTPMMVEKNKHDSENLCSTLNPSGRFATAEEIANLAVVLVSSLGEMVVGSSLYATGGSGTLSFE